MSVYSKTVTTSRITLQRLQDSRQQGRCIYLVDQVKWLEGVAERFSAISFHDSQKVKPLADGAAEVTFAVTGAGKYCYFVQDKKS